MHGRRERNTLRTYSNKRPITHYAKTRTHAACGKQITPQMTATRRRAIVNCQSCIPQMENHDMPEHSMRPLRIYMARTLVFDYTNHRGITTERRVLPESFEFYETPYHKPAQWILHAYDLDRKAVRSFAMKDMSNVRQEGV